MADIKEIADAVRSVSVRTDRFKTSKISICFAMPLKKETAAENALLPFILHHSCKHFPTMRELNRRLAMLYGASVGAGVIKSGEAQIMRLSISAVDDRFAADGEKLSSQCAELLFDMIFEPNFENGVFSKKDLDQEKRLMLERIDSELDDKRLYALTRCEEIMCENEAYGVNKFGTKELVGKITPESLYKAWQTMLKTAVIQINVIGSADIAEIERSFAGRISKIGRTQSVKLRTQFIQKAGEVKRITERMPIKQGKLVMGFRVDMSDAMENYGPFSVMNDVLGGGPYSRLFVNVREKMSLCYYCSSRLVRQKGVLFIQSGIETENKQKATDEIMNQLEIMKKGEFEQSELEASKMAIVDALNAYGDMPSDIDSWYTGQICLAQTYTPDEAIAWINAVTREQVKEMANKLTLDAVFMLEGTDKGEEKEGA